MNHIHIFSLLPLIPKSKNADQTEWALLLRVTVDGKAVEISIKQSAEPSQWNKQKSRVRGNNERAQVIDAIIETFENKAKKHYPELLSRGKWIRALSMKDAILGKEARKHSLLQQFNKHIVEIGNRISVDISKGTYQNNKVTEKHLQVYLTHEHETEDHSLNQLNYEFITGFERYLKTICQNEHNGTFILQFVLMKPLEVLEVHKKHVQLFDENFPGIGIKFVFDQVSIC
jgi:hypothetical protein